MYRRFASLAAVLLMTLTVQVGAAGSADAGTVLNRFHRTCTWSCSPFVQVNGPYYGGVQSNCVTYNWWGGVSGSYVKWGRC